MKVRAWFWTEKTWHGKTMTCRVRLWKLWCHRINWCQLRICCCWKEASESPGSPRQHLQQGGADDHPGVVPQRGFPTPAWSVALKEGVEVCFSGGRGSGTEVWESSGERLLFGCSALWITPNYCRGEGGNSPCQAGGPLCFGSQCLVPPGLLSLDFFTYSCCLSPLTFPFPLHRFLRSSSSCLQWEVQEFGCFFSGSSAPHPCSHLRSSHLIPTHPLWRHPPPPLPDKSSVKVPRSHLRRHLHMLSLLAALHVSEQLHCCSPQWLFVLSPPVPRFPAGRAKGSQQPRELGPHTGLQPPAVCQLWGTASNLSPKNHPCRDTTAVSLPTGRPPRKATL